MPLGLVAGIDDHRAGRNRGAHDVGVLLHRADGEHAHVDHHASPVLALTAPVQIRLEVVPDGTYSANANTANNDRGQDVALRGEQQEDEHEAGRQYRRLIAPFQVGAVFSRA